MLRRSFYLVGNQGDVTDFLDKTHKRSNHLGFDLRGIQLHKAGHRKPGGIGLGQRMVVQRNAKPALHQGLQLDQHVSNRVWVVVSHGGYFHHQLLWKNELKVRARQPFMGAVDEQCFFAKQGIGTGVGQHAKQCD